MSKPKGVRFDDYMAEQYAKKPDLKWGVELAGILLDLELRTVKRFQKNPDASVGDNRALKEMEEFIAAARQDEREKFAAELKNKADINWQLGFPQTVGKQEIDRLTPRKETT